MTATSSADDTKWTIGVCPCFVMIQSRYDNHHQQPFDGPDVIRQTRYNRR